jgi:UDP-GlcNAc:undecaprenyl-phosphate GlcNAc-1-phosphate transferase
MVGFGLTPLIRIIALHMGFVDKPSQRKIHMEPVPLMGGLAIYSSFMLSLLVFDGLSTRSWTLMIGGTALVAIGLVDDWYKSRGREFPVWPRIVVYAAVSVVPVWFGIAITGVSNPFTGGMLLFPEWLSWLATMIWTFALMNMVNFIDGVDGLAAGIVTVSALTLFIIAILKGQHGSALMGAVLAGSCMSFLNYNFYPAQIFMGDAGSVFLGYAIAVLAVDGAFKSVTVISIIVPFLAVGVPILDTLIVFSRRLLTHRALYRADKLHAHHRLLDRGFTQVQTVSLLYVTGILMAMVSILLVLMNV